MTWKSFNKELVWLMSTFFKPSTTYLSYFVVSVIAMATIILVVIIVNITSKQLEDKELIMRSKISGLGSQVSNL